MSHVGAVVREPGEAILGAREKSGKAGLDQQEVARDTTLFHSDLGTGRLCPFKQRGLKEAPFPLSLSFSFSKIKITHCVSPL